MCVFVCVCVCVCVCVYVYVRCGMAVHVVHTLTNYWAIQFSHGYNPADCDVGVYRDNPATHRA